MYRFSVMEVKEVNDDSSNQKYKVESREISYADVIQNKEYTSVYNWYLGLNNFKKQRTK